MTEVLTVGALGSTLLRRWKLIALLAVLGAVAGTAYGVVSPKAYTAKAVLIVMAGASDQSGFYQAAQFAEKRAATYPTLVTAPEVVDATRESLDLPYTSTALLGMVTATNPTDTPVVEIAATSPSPTEAKEIADSIADNIADYAIELERSGARNTSVTIQKAVPAREPTSPTSPSSTILGGLGLLAGGAFGVLVALVLRSIPARRRDPAASGAERGSLAGTAPASAPGSAFAAGSAAATATTAASSRWSLSPRRTEAGDEPSSPERPEAPRTAETAWATEPDRARQHDEPTAAEQHDEGAASEDHARERDDEPGDVDRSPEPDEYDGSDDEDDDGAAARDDGRRGPRAARRPATTVGAPTVRLASNGSPAREGARSATWSR
ncbi:YveK family protein [Oryzobacter terrae]|uniref:YveK family protein n=1 Tax=Oryzobacter terrae TaxID=1620385 RepID=UPI00366DA0D3